MYLFFILLCVAYTFLDILFIFPLFTLYSMQSTWYSRRAFSVSRKYKVREVAAVVVAAANPYRSVFSLSTFYQVSSALFNPIIDCAKLRVFALVRRLIKPVMPNDHGASTSSDTERRIQLSWTPLSTEAYERLCRALDYRANLDQSPLTAVSLMDNQLGPERAAHIATMLYASPHASYAATSLRELRMRFNDIGHEGCEAIAGVVDAAAQLQLIDIGGNDLTVTHLRRLLRAVGLSSTLTHVSLGSNRLGADGAALLSTLLAPNTHLTHLDLSKNDLGPEGAASVASLLRQPASRLHSLQLHSNHLDAAGVRCICAAMQSNKEVKLLTLGNNNATDAAAAELGGMLASNNTLEKLDIRLNSLTGSGVRELAQVGLSRNMALRTLVLAGNDLRAEGAEALASVLCRRSGDVLRELDVSACRLGPQGATRMGHVMSASFTLQELNLSDNAVNDEAAEALADGLSRGLCISALDVSSNAITERAATRLVDAAATNPRLTTLILDDNQASDATQKRLDVILEQRLHNNRVQHAAAALSMSHTHQRTTAQASNVLAS